MDKTAGEMPLTGVKVVDISNFLAGPLVSMFLGDFGAEVIKVERPDTGDELRFWGNNKDGVGLMYKLVNRNKRSVTADLRTELGVEIVKRLVRDADIVVVRGVVGDPTRGTFGKGKEPDLVTDGRRAVVGHRQKTATVREPGGVAYVEPFAGSERTLFTTGGGH